MTMNRKGIVFNDIFLALIISSIVVVMLVIGAPTAYNQLACYTGIKSFFESPAAHIGTVLNLQTGITVESTAIKNYASCKSECDASYSECTASQGSECNALNEKCISYCKGNFSQSNPEQNYVYFYLDINYLGAVPSSLNVSEYTLSDTGIENLLWYTVTDEVEYMGSIKVVTKPFKVLADALPCSIVFKAEPVGKSGVMPGKAVIDRKNINLCIGK